MSMCRHGNRCKHISYLHIQLWPKMGHAQTWAYTDNFSNLHVRPQKKQGLTGTETQLSRATNLASMPIFGHAHLA